MISQIVSDYWLGLTFWLRGWGQIFRRGRLFTIAVIPFLISLVAVFYLIGYLKVLIPNWVTYLTGAIMGISDGWLYDITYFFLTVGSSLIFFIFSIYAIYVLQSLVAIPFYALLAENTLSGRNLKVDGGLRHFLSMLRVGLVKSALLLFVGAWLLIFSFVPVLNIFALMGAMLVLAFDSMDYSFEGLGFGFRERVRYLAREWPQWCGMATGLALTLIMPGLTLLIIPGAVVGAALILKEQYGKIKSSDHS